MESVKKRKVSGINNSQGVNYSVESEIDLDSFAFNWTLKQYSMLSNKDEIESPVICGGPKTNYSWQLLVQPKFRSMPTSTIEVFSVRLQLNDFGFDNTNLDNKRSPVKASFKISLLSEEGTMLHQAETAFTSFEPMKPSEPLKVHSQARKREYVGDFVRRDDTVQLRCEVKILDLVKHSSSSAGMHLETTQETKLRRLENLANDLKDGFSDKKFTDVSLKTETKIFKVHKFVLVARSPVFRLMFTSPMKEAKSSCVKIDNFGANIVENMLEYMYTGETSVNKENVMELFSIADYYELPSLKQDCYRILGENVTVETAVKMLELAFLHDAEDLKLKVLHFINGHKMVLETEKFQDFEKGHPELFKLLYKSQHSI